MKDDDATRLQYRPSPGTGPARATALGRGTHGVPDVRRMVESQFHIAFPHRIWVAGEVGRPEVEDDGALRFPLHAATAEEEFALACVVPAGGVAQLRELLVSGQDVDLEDVVREGRLARVGGLLRYDVARGSVAFLVSDLDATPTSLRLGEERERAVRHVSASGLAERQALRSPVTAPRHVALVGDERDDALHRVEEQLAGSGFDVRLRVLPVRLDTPEGSRRLAKAVQVAAEDADLVLLVRQEGRPLRLSSFDALDAARAVADAPVPVVTGLGGQGTWTACDAVAHAALPTADAAAGWLLARLTEAARVLHELRDDVEREVAAAGARARRDLEHVRDEVAQAADRAQERAEAARSRRRLVLYGGCALLAVLAVAAALLTGRPLLLLGLVLPLAVLAGAHVVADRARTRGSRMGQREDDFAQVLQRLRGVRDELAGTSSPEKVAGLRDVAAQLVEQGERLLRRTLEPGAAPEPRAAGAPEDAVEAAHDGPDGGEGTAPAEQVAGPGAAPPLVPIAAPGADAPTAQTPTPVPGPPAPVADAPTQVAPVPAATPPPDDATAAVPRTGAAEPTQALPTVRRSRPRA